MGKLEPENPHSPKRLRSDRPGRCLICLNHRDEYHYIPYGKSDAITAYFCARCDFTPDKVQPGTFPDNQEV